MAGLCALAGWLAFWPASLEEQLTVASDWRLAIALLGLAVLGQLIVLPLAASYKLMITDAISYTALLLFGPPLAMLLIGVGSLLGQLVLVARGKRGRWDTAFNVGQNMVAVAGAGALLHYALPLRAPLNFDATGARHVVLLVFTAVSLYALETFPACVAASLMRGGDPVRLWINGRRADLLFAVARFLVALVAVVIVQERPWTLVAFVVPVLALVPSLRQAVDRVRMRLHDGGVSYAESMADLVDRRTVYTLQHSRRVASYATQIAQALRLTPAQIRVVRLVARVHDVGKLNVPDSVLGKRGPLSEEERHMIDEHVQVGYDLLARFPEYGKGRELLRWYHTPFSELSQSEVVAETGVVDESVLLGAHVIGVADALDAMTSERPYRRALTLEQAHAELQREQGGRWHPAVVEAVGRLVADPHGSDALRLTRFAIAA